MFIYSLKVNGKKTAKLLLCILLFLVILITFIVCYQILIKPCSSIDKNVNSNSFQEINISNYTNILKNVHDNIDKYVGQKIKFSGYVYRMLDFNQDQFVLARDMVVSSDFKTVVVGFLCEETTIKEYEDYSWIEIEGKITKGNYHGEIPIIKVENIKKINKPKEEYVYPPDDSFVVTSTVL